MSLQDHPQLPPAERLLGPSFSGKVRWFFLTLLLFFLLLFLLSWLIRYPDVISIRVMVQARDGVQRYYAGYPGRIGALPLLNGQDADSGTVLVVWENGADWKDVLRLAETERPEDEAEIAEIDRLRLGELAEPWALARGAWEGLQAARRSALAPALSAPQDRQRAALLDMDAATRRREETLGREVVLARDIWERTQRLAAQKAVSEEALLRAEAEYLRKKAESEAVELESQRISLELAGLEKERLEWTHDDNRALEAGEERWKSAWRLLQARCGDWMQRYLVVARQKGRVAYSRPLEERLWLEEGEPLLAVHSPENARSFVAKGWLPAAGAGKVEPGARVQLRLDAYPYQTYGAVEGKVRQIAPLAENESFLVEIEAPDSLISGTGENLAAGLEMPATARILTSKRRLIDRILDGFKGR